ncbi:type I restriction enzyme S subunit [Leucobacter komagatae]|uniref:Type I restriction enzyme S subunit n=2 Tax=Leucobacter komagatae TaxID=55969 RepID=A0A542Y3R1_9MICO|nr:type I restriction enzyme S subunit [Leucobacter komagatae]
MSKWTSTTLGELEQESQGTIQTGPFGSQLHMSDYSEHGTPVVMPTNIRDLRIDPAGIARVSGEHVERLARHKLQIGDIVYSRRGDVEKCALVSEEEEGWLCGTGCLLVRVHGPHLDARFLSYALSLPETRAWISQHAVGATMPNLNTRLLREVPVKVPGIEDQRAIAATLGALDDKIESNRRAMAKAQELGDALFRSASSDYRAVSDVAMITMGSSPRGETLNEVGEGTPFYQGTRDFGDRFPSLRVWTESPVRLAKKNDTLMSVRAPVGELNRAPFDCCVGRGVAAVHSESQPSTLYYAMRASASTWDKFQGEGTVFASVNKKDVHDSEILWVSNDSAEALELTLSALDDRIESLDREVQRLSRLRDALLPELLSGRLKPGRRSA